MLNKYQNCLAFVGNIGDNDYAAKARGLACLE